MKFLKFKTTEGKDLFLAETEIIAIEDGKVILADSSTYLVAKDENYKQITEPEKEPGVFDIIGNVLQNVGISMFEDAMTMAKDQIVKEQTEKENIKEPKEKEIF